MSADQKVLTFCVSAWCLRAIVLWSPNELQGTNYLSSPVLHVLILYVLGSYFMCTFLSSLSKQWTEVKNGLFALSSAVLLKPDLQTESYGIVKFIQDAEGRCPLGPYDTQTFDPKNPTGFSTHKMSPSNEATQWTPNTCKLALFSECQAIWNSLE